MKVEINMKHWKVVLALFVAVAAITVILNWVLPSAHGTTVSACGTQTQRCLVVHMPVGQEIRYAQGAAFNTTPWMITDASGAPMAWVNAAGLYSGAKPGFVGGKVCTTNVLKEAACLWIDGQGNGVVTLTDNSGSVSLTAADIRWIHSQEQTP